MATKDPKMKLKPQSSVLTVDATPGDISPRRAVIPHVNRYVRRYTAAISATWMLSLSIDSEMGISS